MTTRKPTPKMLRVLRECLAGLGTHHRCRGLSAHGGRSRILTGLRQRGLLDDDYHVTDAGRRLVEGTT